MCRSISGNIMQKIVNAIAIASGVGVLAIVGAGGYLYLNKDALIEKVKGQIMEAVMPSIGGGITDAIPDMTGPAMPSLPSTPF